MPRYIDADALMKEFIDFVRDSNNSDFAPVPTWNDAVSLVGSAPTADVPERNVGKWIPVSERLPGKHRSAIVTDFCHVTLAYTNNLDEWMDYDRNKLKNVTAWMPLPEPYRKETEDAKQ